LSSGSLCSAFVGASDTLLVILALLGFAAAGVYLV
jgi:hypothetical protein